MITRLVKDSKSHQVLLKGNKHGGLYLVSSAPQALLCQQQSSQLWHQCLGHASASSLHSIANKISCNPNKIELCNACCLAKSHILPFQSSSTVVQKPLECVHCDVGGQVLLLHIMELDIMYFLLISIQSTIGFIFVAKRVRLQLSLLSLKYWLKIFYLALSK
jgi:GAG-pre-integrase domain